MKPILLCLVACVVFLLGPMTQVQADTSSNFEVMKYLKDGTNFVLPHGVTVSISDHRLKLVKGKDVYNIEQRTDRFGRVTFRSDLYDGEVTEVDGTLDVSPGGVMKIQFNIHREGGGVMAGQMSEIQAGVFVADKCHCQNVNNWLCTQGNCNAGDKCPADPSDGPNPNYYCKRTLVGVAVVDGPNIIFPGTSIGD